ncbi:MAG: GNAT family N-acetyltransferase [Burkholderiaceae bacterium]
MNAAPFRVQLLDAGHDRAVFQSDSDALNRYFHAQVTQDIRRRVTACYVVVNEADQVAGYYTLAASSVLLNDLPADQGKRLPRYPSVPVVRLGRLAVAQRFKGQGLGGALLADALDRAQRAEIAAYALVVDAKDESAAAFYQHHGFTPLPQAVLTLFRAFGRQAIATRG